MIKSKQKILGYLNYSNDSFTKDGWFKTGDLVELDKNGYIKIILGQRTYQAGGEKVLPGEVESIILELEYISNCIVKSERNSNRTNCRGRH